MDIRDWIDRTSIASTQPRAAEHTGQRATEKQERGRLRNSRRPLLNSVKLSGPSFALVIVASAAIVVQFIRFAPQAVLTWFALCPVETQRESNAAIAQVHARV